METTCKNCAAALSPAEGAGSVTCQFCGATTRLRGAARPGAAAVAIETTTGKLLRLIGDL